MTQIIDFNRELRDALSLKYRGEIAAATANIQVYLHNPAGIGAVSYTHLTLPTIYSV